jgi:hypothetical protein
MNRSLFRDLSWKRKRHPVMELVGKAIAVLPSFSQKPIGLSRIVQPKVPKHPAKLGVRVSCQLFHFQLQDVLLVVVPIPHCREEGATELDLF